MKIYPRPNNQQRYCAFYPFISKISPSDKPAMAEKLPFQISLDNCFRRLSRKASPILVVAFRGLLPSLSITVNAYICYHHVLLSQSCISDISAQRLQVHSRRLEPSKVMMGSAHSLVFGIFIGTDEERFR
jgi:hypothetical protein